MTWRTQKSPSSAAVTTPPKRARHFLHVFLPDNGPLVDPNVHVLLLSQLLSQAGRTTLSYGAMVWIARTGGTQLQVSMLTASGALAALLFGLQGGQVADSLTKRVALALSYALQAALCALVPHFFGTTAGTLVALIFAVSLLTQVTSPAGKAAVAVVASVPALATVNALLSIAGGLGSGLGSGILAPVLIRYASIRWLMYAAGAMFLLAAIRSLKLPTERRGPPAARASQRIWFVGLRTTSEWIIRHLPVATMILGGAIISILADVFQSLQPVYVRTVLHADPTLSIYIFAPGAIGAGLGNLGAPLLLRFIRERALTMVALVFFTAGMMLFGLIDVVTPWLAPYSPLNLLRYAHIHLSQQILAAGAISIIVAFATAIAASAVQTYINRRVPIVHQGATFGMQTVLANGFGVLAMLTLGAIATYAGSKVVFLIAPVVVTFAVIMLVRHSYRYTDEPEPNPREVFASFWDESSEAGA